MASPAPSSPTVAGHPDELTREAIELHLGGKLEVRSRVPIETNGDLALAYTPGVARVSQAIAVDPAEARRLTVAGNSVAVVTDGSAVLGLGDIGPRAALPVMEGKAALFQRFAGIDAWPVCLASKDVDEIVRAVELLAPSFGGINLEDIAAPRCFVIEERLKSSLDIPVFHDDQHGTAIVTLAALLNALTVVGKRLEDVTVAVVGAGAAGVAVTKLLVHQGVGDVVVTDRRGVLGRHRHDDLGAEKRWLVDHTNADGRRGDAAAALIGADVVVGVSGPGVIEVHQLARMGRDPVVFALANPDPEVDPLAAWEHAAVVATGRSDYPNQINNVLAFPGIFRGALDAGAVAITEDMKVAAARALAALVAESQLRPDRIVPSVFDPEVVPAVAAAVAECVTSPMAATSALALDPA